VKRILAIFTAGVTTFAQAPGAARIGFLLFFAAAAADGTLMPFFALWAHKDAGIPIEFIGLLLGCYAGGELLATPFLGGIADRIGRRPVLLVSTSGVGLGFLCLYFVHGAVAAAAALLAIGVFESVLHPTAGTVIADVVPAETRRAHFALRRVMSNAGGMAGPALGALLALHSLRLVFIGAAAMLLIAAAVVAVSLHETRPKSAIGEADDDDESLLVLGAVFRDSRLAGVLLPVAVLEIALSWIQAVTPLYADAAGTLTASGIGLLFAYAGALGVVLQFPLTQATSRMSGFAIVLYSGVMQAAAFAFLFASPVLASLVADHASGFVANVLRSAGADGCFRVRAKERASNLSGGLLRGVRSARRRRTRDRDLAVCDRRRIAMGERRRHLVRCRARSRRRCPPA
jgi:DHA1 family tetracycline resistance protein-like MFS transporter